MLATYPAYRPMHFEAAVEAKKHIFCEKPFGTDPVNVRRFMAAAKKSEELKLTVKSGAQRRSQAWYLDQYKRMKNGDIGDIVALNANWVGSPVLNFEHKLFPNHKRDPKWGDMEFQTSQLVLVRVDLAATRLWSSTCTTSMSATGSWARIRWKWWLRAALRGGRARKSTATSTTTSHADFVYPNGVHMASHCRQYQGQGIAQNVSERIVGTKGVIDSAAQRGGASAGRSVRAGAHRHGEQHPGQGTVHQRSHDSGGKHHDLPHGPRGRLFGTEGHLGHDDELRAGPAAEKVRLQGRVPVPPLPVPGVYKFV